MSRIANWHELTEGEREAAKRAVARRNAARKRRLLEAEAEEMERSRTPIGRLRTHVQKFLDPYSPLWRSIRRRLFVRQRKLAPEHEA